MTKTPKRRPGVIGEAVLRARNALGLTQKDLAKLARVHRTTLAEIESGTTGEPDFDTIEKLAKALNLETADLTAGAPSAQPVTKSGNQGLREGRSDRFGSVPPSLQAYLERHGDDVTHKEAQLAARLGFKLDDEAPELDPETFWNGIFETIRKSRKGA